MAANPMTESEMCARIILFHKQGNLGRDMLLTAGELWAESKQSNPTLLYF